MKMLCAYRIFGCLRRRSRCLHDDEGATLVEFAVSILVFLMGLFGIMELCLLFYSYNVVSEISRDAARWAIVRGSTSCDNTPGLADCDATAAQIQSFVQNQGYPGLASSNLSVTTTWKSATTSGTPATTTWTTCSSGTCNAPGNAVNVQVSYAFPLSVPGVPFTTVNLRSNAQMVVAQ